MNAQDTLVILQALQVMGATHFKSQDFEIRVGESTPARAVDLGPPFPPAGPIQTGPIAPAPAFNADATARAQDLIDKLKMKDSELLNTIFPDGAGG